MTTRRTTEQAKTLDNGRETDESPQARTTSSNGVAANGAGPPAMQRAEEMVDHMAERVGHYAGVVGHQVLWFLARAREEAEDIWAEAQSVRRHKTADGSANAASQSNAEPSPVSADRPR